MALLVIFGERGTVLEPIGTIFVNLSFILIVPMVYVLITNAVENMTAMSRLGKIVRNTICVFAMTGLVAAALALVAVNLYSIEVNTVHREEISGVRNTADISNIFHPMGTTMHMDRVVLSGITKIAFLCSVYHLPWQVLKLIFSPL